MSRVVRILKVKEEDVVETNVSKKKLSPKWKIVSLGAFVALTIFGLTFVSSFPGVIFDPYQKDYVVGWADIRVQYVTFSGDLFEYNGPCSIDLYYAANGTQYEENLSLSAFPYYIDSPTTFLINDTSNEFQFQYAMLLGNPNNDDPFVNHVLFKREAYDFMIDGYATIMNFTYANYSSIDNLNPIVSLYDLGYNLSKAQQFSFGSYNPLLKFNLTDLPFGYTWGASTYVPPDLFESLKSDYEIAYRNGFNRIGLFLAFNCDVNLSILLYGAENYNYFCELQTYEVNITQEPEPEKLWVTALHDIDSEQEKTFQFETNCNFSSIYFWSGWLDDYNSSFIYNRYDLKEV